MASITPPTLKARRASSFGPSTPTACTASSSGAVATLATRTGRTAGAGSEAECRAQATRTTASAARAAAPPSSGVDASWLHFRGLGTAACPERELELRKAAERVESGDVEVQLGIGQRASRVEELGLR